VIARLIGGEPFAAAFEGPSTAGGDEAFQEFVTRL
jgi:hypothetical protein